MLVGQTIGTGSYRFEIEQELGSGAMGTVYRAQFHKDGKVSPVALKIVALGLLGNELAGRAGNGTHPTAAGKMFGRTRLVGEDVGFAA